MRTLSQVLGVARADFGERVRAQSFSVAVILMLLIAYAVATGKLRLRLGHYEGVMNTAWIGSMLALTISTFVALFSFYLINNTIALDLRSGVHQLLAASPLSRRSYCFGKWLGSTSLLMSLVIVLFAAGMIVQWIRGEADYFDFAAVLALMVAVALPMMALVAAAGLLFETTAWLRGGAGNLLWILCFLVVIQVSAKVFGPWSPALDLSGLELIRSNLVRCVQAVDPQFDGRFALTFIAHGNFQSIGCNPIEWSFPLLIQRFALIGVSAGVVLIAAWRFDRFVDADKEPVPPVASWRKPYVVSLLRAGPPMKLMFEELRLMLLEGGTLWLVGVSACIAIALLVPMTAISWVLLGAWLLPVLPLSRLGCREYRHGTQDLLMTVPVLQLIGSRWIAGFILLLASATGVLIRYAIENDIDGIAAVIASACFVASLAVACGVIATSEKMFQVTYVALIYVGPLNGVPLWNFVSVEEGDAWRWAAYAVAGLLMAALTRYARRWM